MFLFAAQRLWFVSLKLIESMILVENLCSDLRSFFYNKNFLGTARGIGRLHVYSSQVKFNFQIKFSAISMIFNVSQHLQSICPVARFIKNEIESNLVCCAQTKGKMFLEDIQKLYKVIEFPISILLQLCKEPIFPMINISNL